MSARRTLFALVPIAVVTIACTAPKAEDQEPEQGVDDTVPGQRAGGDAASGSAAKPPGDGGSGSSDDSCPYTGPPIDVSGFAKCLDGGRCVPEKLIPEAERKRLAKCDTGLCVPEKIIVAKGNYLPKACTSFASIEGRCISTVFPDIAAQKDRLPQDTCDANERCAPCFDPLGKETGACRSVSCDAPKTAGKALPACCNQQGTTKGRCLPKSMMPKEAASGLEAKECQSTDLCVPEEMLDEKFVPPKCTASSIIGSYAGVCISTCVARDFLTNIATDKGTCSDGHFCAPCNNPLTGEATGAPGCGP